MSPGMHQPRPCQLARMHASARAMATCMRAFALHPHLDCLLQVAQLPLVLMQKRRSKNGIRARHDTRCFLHVRKSKLRAWRAGGARPRQKPGGTSAGPTCQQPSAAHRILVSALATNFPACTPVWALAAPPSRGAPAPRPAATRASPPAPLTRAPPPPPRRAWPCAVRPGKRGGRGGVLLDSESTPARSRALLLHKAAQHLALPPAEAAARLPQSRARGPPPLHHCARAPPPLPHCPRLGPTPSPRVPPGRTCFPCAPAAATPSALQPRAPGWRPRCARPSGRRAA